MSSKREYYMEHPRTGYCLIFTHHRYKGTRETTRYSQRTINQVSDTFHQLGFDVLVQKNYTKRQITSLLNNIASLDHNDEDCLAIIVLGARRHNGMLCAYDGEYPEENLWQPFSSENCPSLKGKPKLLFIQTFRQNGTLSVGDANFISGAASSTVSQGPIPEDCLISWSKMEDFRAYKRMAMEDAFVRYLCRELMTNTPLGLDLISILSRVGTSVMNSMLMNQGVGEQMASQWPTFATTLSGTIIFLRKNEENMRRIEPIDKDLENFSESESENGEDADETKGEANGTTIVKVSEPSEDITEYHEGQKESEIEEGKVNLADTEYSATFLQLFQRILFFFLYIADEGSDLYAAFKHVIYGRMVFAHLTFFFAILPHIHSVWIGKQKAKIAKVKFDFIEALTFHIKSLWQSLVYAIKSRKSYDKLTVQEERAYNVHVRAWKGLGKSEAWDGDSKKIQRMYYEKMMTINLNLVPFEYLEVANQAPFQIRSQLASLMIQKRIPTTADTSMIISIFTSLVSLTSATHKDHYRVHFSPDWSNNLDLRKRALECTSILLIRSAHAVAMSTVAASQPLWIYCICQMPHSAWGLFLFIKSMSRPRYHFKKNPVKNAISLMGRTPSRMVFPWEYKTVENVLFLLDVVLLILSWRFVPSENVHPILNWYTPLCIVSVHFIAMCLSFVYRTYCHRQECNPEVEII